jgi:hypothetical protein
MTKYYPVTSGTADHRRHHHFRATGEFRPPMKGEHYLSGAIVEVYQARADLTTPYHIATMVRTKVITFIVEDV